MEEKIFDQEIKDALLKATDASLNLKKDIWEGIESKIEYYESQKGVKTMKKSKIKSIFTAITLTAAALGIAFFTSTNAGRAAVAKIREILAPEKVIVQDIEGQKEDTKVNLNEGPGYVIYVDESMYHVVKQDGKDRIVPNVDPGDNLPEVYMEIQRVANKSPQEMAAQLETELKSSFETVENYGIVEDPVESISLHARNGLKHDSTIVRYYLVDDKQGGTFVIKQQYFLEAAEGHGARFYHMLREFKIVTSQE
jgi:hypothetical protein